MAVWVVAAVLGCAGGEGASDGGDVETGAGGADPFGNSATPTGAAGTGWVTIHDGGALLRPDGAVVPLALRERACPQDSQLTYDDFARGFFADYCLRCHAADRTGTDREGAPVGVDFDSLAEIRAHADAIWALAADDNTRMPAAGEPPSAAERRALGDWLACGAP